MSKRHQASRRKAYGRRQHEVRERHDRRTITTASDRRARRRGAPARPVRSARLPRSARAAAPLRARRLTMAVYEGARPRTIALPRRPRLADAARRCRAGVARARRVRAAPHVEPPRPAARA